MEICTSAVVIFSFILTYPVVKFSGATSFQPEFIEYLDNMTVPIGRDVTFKCLVQNLGGYRVGWVKADTKAIQAIHIHVITYNPRVSVSHVGTTIWNLHIKNVQQEDQGYYMCQINTDPMKSQMGFLQVVVPPDFMEDTSSDMLINEGGTAHLICKAFGVPKPRIQWRREDGSDIVIRDAAGNKIKVPIYEESELIISKISRHEMGAYLCIASNGVPPSVSKRIVIKVHFHPVIQVPNQLVGAPLGTDVTLECLVEASPKSINFWVRDSNEMVISSNKYEVLNRALSPFANQMLLTVHRLTFKDLGGYKCVAKNSLGEVDSVIRLYDIPGPSTSRRVPTESDNEGSTDEGLEVQSGSADSSDEEEEEKDLNRIEDQEAQANNVHHQKLGKENRVIHKVLGRNEIDFVDNNASRLPFNNFVSFLTLILYCLYVIQVHIIN